MLATPARPRAACKAADSLGGTTLSLSPWAIRNGGADGETLASALARDVNSVCPATPSSPSTAASNGVIQVVDTVQWFRVNEQGTGRSTWFVVDRPVYVALTLPPGAGATPIQQMSELVAAKLPAVPIRPGPPR